MLCLLVGVIFVASIFLFQGICFAQKIAFVDLAVVFDGYEKTKDYDVKLDGARKTEQEKIDKKVEEIKTLQDKLPLLSEGEKTAKQGEIDKLARDLQDYQRTAETTLIKDRNDKLEEVLKDIQGVVDELAKQEGYDIIVNNRALLYGNNSLDITTTVVKKLNEKYKKKG
jgi:outer membrane protein